MRNSDGGENEWFHHEALMPIAFWRAVARGLLRRAKDRERGFAAVVRRIMQAHCEQEVARRIYRKYVYDRKQNRVRLYEPRQLTKEEREEEMRRLEEQIAELKVGRGKEKAGAHIPWHRWPWAHMRLSSRIKILRAYLRKGDHEAAFRAVWVPLQNVAIAQASSENEPGGCKEFPWQVELRQKVRRDRRFLWEELFKARVIPELSDYGTTGTLKYMVDECMNQRTPPATVSLSILSKAFGRSPEYIRQTVSKSIRSMSGRETEDYKDEEAYYRKMLTLAQLRRKA